MLLVSARVGLDQSCGGDRGKTVFIYLFIFNDNNNNFIYSNGIDLYL